MNNKDILAALSQDLYRYAIGLNRGSRKMAKLFLQEALERKNEINLLEVKPYIKKLLQDVLLLSFGSDVGKNAEDALMYSILFRNAARS